MAVTEYSAPFTTSSLATEYQWSRLARRWGLDGVIADDTVGSDLKVTASGTNTVLVAPGEAFVNGFYYSLTGGNLSVNVTSNATGGSARVDLVVLRLDPSADSIHPVYKTGGTSAPALTQDPAGIWEIPIAQCTVLAGATVVQTAAAIDTRWFIGKGVAIGLAGQRRPPTKGQLLVEGKNIYLGNGTSWDWLAVAGGTGVSSGISVAGGFVTNTSVVKCQIMNGWAFWSGTLKLSSGASIPAGSSQLGTVAAGCQPTDFIRYGICPSQADSAQQSARIEVRPDRTMWVVVPFGGSPLWVGLDGLFYPLTTPS